MLDQTASSLYCAEGLWGPLHQDPVRAVTDPVGVITRWAWTVRTAVEGVCAGAMMSTKSWGGDRHEVKTLLLVEAGAPQAEESVSLRSQTVTSRREPVSRPRATRVAGPGST